MHFPTTPIKQGLETMHNGGEHRVEVVSTSQRRFQRARIKHLHGHCVPKKAGDKSEHEHEWKRQRHCAVKDDHRDDVNVGVKHPVERRNENFDDLREENEDDEKDEEDHRGNFELRIPNSE